MSVAQRQTGKPWHVQLLEIRSLARMGGKCGATDYFWHRMYDDRYIKGRGRKDFLGWRLLEDFSRALNPRHVVLPAWDKAVFTQLADSAGLPVAPVLAFFHPTQRIPKTLGLHLTTRDAAGTFLRCAANYPLFGKPAYSQGGCGAAYLSSYDASSDSVVLLSGDKLPVLQFLVRLEHPVDPQFHRPQCGYLFQSAMRPATEIAAIAGSNALCGVRVICLNGSEGVRVVRAIWKIAVPPNCTDNFGVGDRGNLLADVDLETGEVGGSMRGMWPHAELFSEHPVTGQPIDGFRLPGWDRILSACRLAGEVFPLMKIHHWDFALTDQGPLMLELNDIGGTQIPQMHGRGLLTEEIRDFLKRYGDRRTYRWIEAL